ncbi:hypothetical protein [Vagococcus sp. CY53-2]|uniref:hypothetical protein n=1 Tax=Vagococcus sp. CY53-2 TaxID=2925780 RepID=UPI001F50816C|nr:hypothetical protein [Vagococcus sp. CY53-2]MCI0130035.1 hypothetical protein [Vagococcus sp. CY53-2]
MEEKNKLFDFEVDSTPLNYDINKTIYNQDTQFMLRTDDWKQTFRRTNNKELLNLIKENTISQEALIRLCGSYSTKSLNNLATNKIIMKGIKTRPIKVFFDEECNINNLLVNEMLSYIPFFFYKYNQDANSKLYIDNLVLFNNKLYFTIYLKEDVLVETECLYINEEDLVRDRIQTSAGNNNKLKIFITDVFNSRVSKRVLKKKIKEDFILITMNEQFNSMYSSIYTKDTEVKFLRENLLLLKDVQQSYKDVDLYNLIKGKYEFERKTISRNK